jgi:hypothetical protein
VVRVPFKESGLKEGSDGGSRWNDMVVARSGAFDVRGGLLCSSSLDRGRFGVLARRRVGLCRPWKSLSNINSAQVVKPWYGYDHQRVFVVCW